MYLGIDPSLKGDGLLGKVSEFYMTYGAIKQETIGAIKNMLKVFDLTTMGYYSFHSSDQNKLGKDAFRDQGAKIVYS